MDLHPTESNITERETASDSEVQIDPGLDVGDVGPSTAPSCGTHPPQPATSPPAASSQQANPEEQDNSSSPTLALDTSPQATTIPRRGRRRRERAATGTRRQVDRGVLDYLSSAAHDDGEEAYGRSLAQYLRAIPREFRLRARGSLQIVLDSCTQPNHPGTVFRFLERWQLSTENLVFLQGSQAVQGPASSEPLPPPRMSPSPPRMPTPKFGLNRPNILGTAHKANMINIPEPMLEAGHNMVMVHMGIIGDMGKLVSHSDITTNNHIPITPTTTHKILQGWPLPNQHLPYRVTVMLPNKQVPTPKQNSRLPLPRSTITCSRV
ncbi:uncharacterized protein [Dendrobates tinctorius]|uniref:uncharacterized protein n=1 Tax=Dendrobates tinctorius TaxID=92724 RepID=UPI003CC9BCD5